MDASRSDVVKVSSRGNLRKMLEGRVAGVQHRYSHREQIPPPATPPHTGLMISISGIRGVIGSTLTPDRIARYSAAFGTWANGGTVVVGRDSRVSGDMVKTAVFSGLEATGCRIVDVGIVPTPTVEIAVKNLKAHGGIAITASHNPIEWNALKLIGPKGLFLNQDRLNEVLEIADHDSCSYVSWDRLGRVEFYDYAVQNHIDLVTELEYLNVEELQRRRFRVVVDCVNGTGGTIIPKLLQLLGCEVTVLNEEAHGIFPRNPEPAAENLSLLEEAVAHTGADVGFALDPDADRLAVVSEQGKAIGEELTLALATYFVLSKKRGPVVVNASTTRAMDDLAARYEVPCHRTRIGEIHVSGRMAEVHAVIGGEGNGGVILPDVHLGRDACTGVALLLQLMCSTGKTVTQLVSEIPHYVMRKDKVHVEQGQGGAIIEKIIQKYRSRRLDLTDGVKILMDGSWVHMRTSNTEPVVRIIAEAPDGVTVNRLLKEFTSYFHKG